MISKETYDKLQEYKEIGLSILKSSEKLNLSYKTAYTWWNKSDEEFTSFQKQHEFMLDNYRQYLIEQIKICPQINNSLLLKRLKLEFQIFQFHRQPFIIFVTNRPLSEWEHMDVDKHIVTTFRQRIMTDAQLIHLG